MDRGPKGGCPAPTSAANQPAGKNQVDRGKKSCRLKPWLLVFYQDEIVGQEADAQHARISGDSQCRHHRPVSSSERLQPSQAREDTTSQCKCDLPGCGYLGFGNRSSHAPRITLLFWSVNAYRMRLHSGTQRGFPYFTRSTASHRIVGVMAALLGSKRRWLIHVHIGGGNVCPVDVALPSLLMCVEVLFASPRPSPSLAQNHWLTVSDGGPFG